MLGVLDPYAGVGSSLIAALKRGCRAIGCDKESIYVDIAKDRIVKFYQGKLPIRPMDREPYQPQGKVSRVPVEWKNGVVVHVYGDDEVMEESNEGTLF